MKEKKANRLGIFAVIFLIGWLIILCPAYADVIEFVSNIVKIDTSYKAHSYLKVFHTDSQTGKTEEIKVGVDDSTLFLNSQSIRDFKVGEKVAIRANYNTYTHEWKALFIKPYK